MALTCARPGILSLQRTPSFVHKVVATLCIASLCWSAGATLPRGVNPANAKQYGDDTQFTCTSGTKTISASQVNDQSCDCSDGSDEPGTSACPNGEFYCPNLGYRPLVLRTMFVDDRICDCCDGSDEKAGRCPNTCAELGEELAAETKRKVEKHRAGFVERTKVMELAVSQLQSLVSETEALQAEVAELKPEVEQLQETKDKLMAELREREAKVPEVVEEPPEPVEFKDPRDPANWELDDDDEEHEAYHADAEDAVAGSQAPPDEEPVEDPEEVARRIAAQWTNDPAAAGRSAEGAAKGAAKAAASTAKDTATQAVDTAKEAAPSMMQRLTNTISNVLGSGPGSAEAPVRTDTAPAGVSSDQLAVNELRSRAHTARDEHDKKKRDLDAKNERLATVTARLTQDHGPNQVFMYMYDQCFETLVDKYTYKVCGFGKASQVDKGSETSLGTFEGYNEDHTEMTFTNGAGCWQGPNRSLRVKLECGPRTEILSVDEPSRCVYVANMATPALCSHEALVAAQDELKQLTAL